MKKSLLLLVLMVMTIFTNVHASTKVKQDTVAVSIDKIEKAISVKKDDKTKYYVVLKDGANHVLVKSNKTTVEFILLCKEQKCSTAVVAIRKNGRISRITKL